MTSLSVPYKVFCRRNPKYNLEYWERCRAFYKGGSALLENDCVMSRVFPKQNSESAEVYEARKKMAHYTNYAGELINHTVALLNSNPVSVSCGDGADKFYSKFNFNVSPTNIGDQCHSLSELVARKMMLTAQQCKLAWALVELPKNETEYTNLATQEADGSLNAWAVEIQPECVIDWEMDEHGKLIWALLKFTANKRENLLDDRSVTTETYTYYDSQTWVKWEVKWKDEPPKEDTAVPVIDSGTHSFGAPPLVCMEMPDGLWSMSKLESLCREHLNKRNALSWAEYKALLPVLYEFLDPGIYPQLPGPGGEEDRAVAQRRGPSYVQERQAKPGDGDKAQWIAPSEAPFQHALNSCNGVREEMHRVLHEMALASDYSNKMMARSGESKKMDIAALSVVLEALGAEARKTAIHIMSLCAAGRGDLVECTAVGMDDFDAISTADMLSDESILDETVQMPSATFKKIRKRTVARKILGDWATPEELDQVMTEIDSYYSQERAVDDTEFKKAQVDYKRESVRAKLERNQEAQGGEGEGGDGSDKATAFGSYEY